MGVLGEISLLEFNQNVVSVIMSREFHEGDTHGGSAAADGGCETQGYIYYIIVLMLM